ncbi:MAG: hypothetical protein ABIK68_01980 [bacterium]
MVTAFSLLFEKYSQIPAGNSAGDEFQAFQQVFPQQEVSDSGLKVGSIDKHLSVR